MATAGDTEAVVRALYDAWSSGRWDGVRGQLAPQVSWDGETKTADGVVAALRDNAEREFRFEVFEVVVTEPGTTAARVVHHGRAENLETKFTTHFFDVSRFAGSLLIERTTYKHRLEALDAAGVVAPEGVLVSRSGEDDWRLTWQEDYLQGKELVWHEWSAPPPGRAWRLANGSVMWARTTSADPPANAVEEVEPPQWDHDHCDFCWAKFMDVSRYDEDWRRRNADVLSAGYTPAPPDSGFGNAWICPECFEDFKHRFGWIVVNLDGA